MRSDKTKKTERKKQDPLPVAILRTCHQLYDEASKILYEETPFYFRTPQDPLWMPPRRDQLEIPFSNMLWKTIGRITYLKLDMLAAPKCPLRSNRDNSDPWSWKLTTTELAIFMNFLARYALVLKHLVIVLEIEWHIIDNSSLLAAALRMIEDEFPEPINSMRTLRKLEIEMPDDPENLISKSGARW